MYRVSSDERERDPFPGEPRTSTSVRPHARRRCLSLDPLESRERTRHPTHVRSLRTSPQPRWSTTEAARQHPTSACLVTALTGARRPSDHQVSHRLLIARRRSMACKLACPCGVTRRCLPPTRVACAWRPAVWVGGATRHHRRPRTRRFALTRLRTRLVLSALMLARSASAARRRCAAARPRPFARCAGSVGTRR
jgi:hypothetical protein